MASYYETIARKGAWELDYDPFTEDELPNLYDLTWPYRVDLAGGDVSKETATDLDQWLAQIESYNYSLENLSKEEVAHQAKKTALGLSLSKLDALTAGSLASKSMGEAGFEGSGIAETTSKELEEVFSADVTTGLSQMEKQFMGGKLDIRGQREEYVEDLWAEFDYWQQTGDMTMIDPCWTTQGDLVDSSHPDCYNPNTVPGGNTVVIPGEITIP